MSGYTQCACRDCFEIAISDDETLPELCWECEEAGCSPDGDCECCREDAYCAGEDDGYDSDYSDEGML